MLELGKQWALLGTATILCSGCALFDEDSAVPERLLPVVNNTSANNSADDAGPGDAGPNDAGPSDAGTSVDAGIPVDASPDADVGEIDMGFNGPWNCRPVELATDALSFGEVQIEPLGQGRFVGTWSTAPGAQTVEVFESDGTLLDSVTFDDLIQRPQRIELLSDGSENYYVYSALNSGLELDTCTLSGCTSQVSKRGLVGAVDGFWNGGDQIPYVQVLDDGSHVTFVIVDGEPTVMSAAEDGSWISLALTSVPSDPMLTSPLFLSFVKDGAVFTASRPDSGTPVGVTPEDCGVASGSLGKVFSLPDQKTFVADARNNGGGTVILRATCGVSEQTIAESLIGLNDWAVVETAGSTFTFHADQDGLSASVYDGAIRTNSVAVKNVELVDATTDPGGNLAVLTVDTDGVVELRQMSTDGTCL